MPAPVASGWSVRRVGLAPTGKAPPCHGARGFRSFADTHNQWLRAPIPAVRAPMIGRLKSVKSPTATRLARLHFDGEMGEGPEPGEPRAIIVCPPRLRRDDRDNSPQVSRTQAPQMEIG